MNRFVRQLVFAAVLLGLFLATSLLALQWMRERTDELHREAIAQRRGQLAEALQLAGAGTEPPAEETLRRIGRAIGAEISLAGRPPGKDTRWTFTHPLAPAPADGGPRVLFVSITPPPTARLAVSALRTVALCTVVGLGLVVLFAVVALFNRRSIPADADPDGGASGTNQALAGIAQIARVSAQQGAELAQERSQRQLAEGDLHLKQQMLERAWADKVQMGRDLHDGIIQSLYATALTLQTAKRQLAPKPAEAAQLLDSSLQTLNATIGEIRRYIGGLTDAGLRQASFTEAVHELSAVLGAGRTVDFEVRIDEDAAGELDEPQFSELLQVVREAVSNGLRHGAARRVTVRLHRSEGEVCLLVQDDGRGFTPGKTSGGGHGLANMEARARRLGGALRCTSAPDQGTRIVVTFAARPRPSA